MNKYNLYKIETTKLISFLGDFRKNFLLKNNINDYYSNDLYNKLYNLHNQDNNIFNIIWLNNADIKETDKFIDIYEKDANFYFNLINNTQFNEKQKQILKLDFLSFINKKLNFIKKSNSNSNSRVKSFYLTIDENFIFNFSNKSDLLNIVKQNPNNQINFTDSFSCFLDLDKRLEFLENNLNNFNYEKIDWVYLEKNFNNEQKEISNSKKLILENNYQYVLKNFNLEKLLQNETDELKNEILTCFIGKIESIDYLNNNYQFLFKYVLQNIHTINKNLHFKLSKIFKSEDLFQLYNINKEIVNSIDDKDFYRYLIEKNNFSDENEKQKIILKYLNKDVSSYFNESFIFKYCILENDEIIAKIFNKQTFYYNKLTDEQLELIKKTIINSKNKSIFLTDNFYEFLTKIKLSEKVLFNDLNLNDLITKPIGEKFQKCIYKKEYFDLLNNENKIKMLSYFKITDFYKLDEQLEFFKRVLNTNNKNLIEQTINNRNLSSFLKISDLDNDNLFSIICQNINHITNNNVLLFNFLKTKDISLKLKEFPLLFYTINLGQFNSFETKKYFLNYMKIQFEHNVFLNLKPEYFFLINQPDILKNLFQNINTNNEKFFIQLINNNNFDKNIFTTIEFIEILCDISKKIPKHSFNSIILNLPQQQKDFFNKISLNEDSYSVYLEKLLLNLNINKNIEKTEQQLVKKNKI